MANASTPTLIVSPGGCIRRLRKVPVNGHLLVQAGDIVTPRTPVARAMTPGRVHSIGAAAILGVSRARLGQYLSVREGDAVSTGQVLAASSSLFGLFRTTVSSPADGTVESISSISGHILIRERPIPREILAYVSGRVASADRERGVEIEGDGALVQGVFGLGQETYGTLVMVHESQVQGQDAHANTPELEGCIACAPFHLALDALKAFLSRGVAGVVAASVDAGDLNLLLGREVNFASTGDEDVGYTLMLTEGFGVLPMGERARTVLDALAGSDISLSGITQVRAGVIRPELIGPGVSVENWKTGPVGIEEGTLVRIVRGRLFGQVGQVIEAPVNPVTIDSGTTVLVYRVRLVDGTVVEVPRPNVEL